MRRIPTEYERRARIEARRRFMWQAIGCFLMVLAASLILFVAWYLIFVFLDRGPAL